MALRLQRNLTLADARKAKARLAHSLTTSEGMLLDILAQGDASVFGGLGFERSAPHDEVERDEALGSDARGRRLEDPRATRLGCREPRARELASP